MQDADSLSPGFFEKYRPREIIATAAKKDILKFVRPKYTEIEMEMVRLSREVGDLGTKIKTNSDFIKRNEDDLDGIDERVYDNADELIAMESDLSGLEKIVDGLPTWDDINETNEKIETATSSIAPIKGDVGKNIILLHDMIVGSDEDHIVGEASVNLKDVNLQSLSDGIIDNMDEISTITEKLTGEGLVDYDDRIVDIRAKTDTIRTDIGTPAEEYIPIADKLDSLDDTLEDICNAVRGIPIVEKYFELRGRFPQVIDLWNKAKIIKNMVGNRADFARCRKVGETTASAGTAQAVKIGPGSMIMGDNSFQIPAYVAYEKPVEKKIGPVYANTTGDLMRGKSIWCGLGTLAGRTDDMIEEVSDITDKVTADLKKITYLEDLESYLESLKIWMDDMAKFSRPGFITHYTGFTNRLSDIMDINGIVDGMTGDIKRTWADWQWFKGSPDISFGSYIYDTLHERGISYSATHSIKSMLKPMGLDLDNMLGSIKNIINGMMPKYDIRGFIIERGDLTLERIGHIGSGGGLSLADEEGSIEEEGTSEEEVPTGEYTDWADWTSDKVNFEKPPLSEKSSSFLEATRGAIGNYEVEEWYDYGPGSWQAKYKMTDMVKGFIYDIVTIVAGSNYFIETFRGALKAVKSMISTLGKGEYLPKIKEVLQGLKDTSTKAETEYETADAHAGLPDEEAQRAIADADAKVAVAETETVSNDQIELLDKVQELLYNAISKVFKFDKPLSEVRATPGGVPTIKHRRIDRIKREELQTWNLLECPFTFSENYRGYY